VFSTQILSQTLPKRRGQARGKKTLVFLPHVTCHR
jgi:hypothetical protein